MTVQEAWGVIFRFSITKVPIEIFTDRLFDVPGVSIVYSCSILLFFLINNTCSTLIEILTVAQCSATRNQAGQQKWV